MTGPLRYPEAFVRYLAEFHGSRDYFECHEIMEEYWKEQPVSRHSGCWLVLIRIAVASYHARRSNWPGARKMMAKAAQEADPALLDELGFDGAALAGLLQATNAAWQAEPAPLFRDLSLPFRGEEPQRSARMLSERQGWEWERSLSADREEDGEIVHRHTRRDRSEVVEARRQSAQEKSLRRKPNGDGPQVR